MEIIAQFSHLKEFFTRIRIIITTAPPNSPCKCALMKGWGLTKEWCREIRWRCWETESNYSEWISFASNWIVRHLILRLRSVLPHSIPRVMGSFMSLALLWASSIVIRIVVISRDCEVNRKLIPSWLSLGGLCGARNKQDHPVHELVKERVESPEMEIMKNELLQSNRDEDIDCYYSSTNL